MSCVLVEDITAQNLPVNVKSLLASLSSSDPVSRVLVVVYTLMLECGLDPVGPSYPAAVAVLNRGFSVQRLKQFNRLPPGWDDSDQTLHRQTFQLGDLAEHKCQLIVSRVCDSLIVNLTVNNFPSSFVREPLYVVHVLPWHFVVSTSAGWEYRDMKKLSTKLKDSLIMPVVCGILRRYGLPHASLLGLPDEVSLKILRDLPIAGVSAMSRVSRSLNALCQDDLLWQHLYRRDKINAPPDGGHGDVSYKTKYSKSVAWSRQGGKQARENNTTRMEAYGNWIGMPRSNKYQRYNHHCDLNH